MGLIIAPFLLSASAPAQEPQPKETLRDGYSIHQSVDLGGRVVDTSGSGAMYDTLVNLQSGPRILSQSLDMHAAPNTDHPFFDELTESSSGYGGDPYDVTSLRLSKGKLYRLPRPVPTRPPVFRLRPARQSAGPSGGQFERLHISAGYELATPVQHGAADDRCRTHVISYFEDQFPHRIFSQYR